MKALVVHRSATMRRILRHALQHCGFETVNECTDGRAALTTCDPTYTLVVTGWSVPGIDGVQLTRELRARGDTSAVPVLMVSARQAMQDVSTAIEAGVTAYVLRPFDRETLERRITEIVAPEMGEESKAA